MLRELDCLKYCSRIEAGTGRQLSPREGVLRMSMQQRTSGSLEWPESSLRKLAQKKSHLKHITMKRPHKSALVDGIGTLRKDSLL